MNRTKPPSNRLSDKVENGASKAAWPRFVAELPYTHKRKIQRLHELYEEDIRDTPKALMFNAEAIGDMERIWLINLYHQLRARYSEQEEFGLREIAWYVPDLTDDYLNAKDPRDAVARVLNEEASVRKLRELVDCVRKDQARDLHPAGLVLGMRYPTKGYPARRTRPDSSPDVQWMLFLNDDYLGGELYFPGAKLAFRPRAGMCVNWGARYAHGIAPVERGDAYQFYLAGFGVKGAGAREEWPSPDQALGAP